MFWDAGGRGFGVRDELRSLKISCFHVGHSSTTWVFLEFLVQYFLVKYWEKKRTRDLQVKILAACKTVFYEQLVIFVTESLFHVPGQYEKPGHLDLNPGHFLGLWLWGSYLISVPSFIIAVN